MRLGTVLIIFRKDLDDVVRSKYVLLSIIMMPIFFALVIPLSTVLPLMYSSDEEITSNADDISFFLKFKLTDNWGELNDQEKFFVLSIEFSLMIFLLLPMILPTVIAADSFAGEKDRGTVESLIAAPISDSELYLGKLSGALAPTVISTWIASIPFALIINYASNDVLGYSYYPNVNFFLAVFIFGPLLGFASTNFMMWVSTKTNSSRDAQQLGSLIILPLMLILFSAIGFSAIIDQYFMLAAIGVVVLLDFVLYFLGVRILNREKWLLTHL